MAITIGSYDWPSNGWPVALTGATELPLESWRVPYAASGWMTAVFSYWMGDINDAAVCRRVTL